ncbi:MAG: capsule assembly Wzi family protein [Cytophagales bacterium]
MKKKSLNIAILAFFQISVSIGQVIDVGTPIVEEQLRRLQLTSDSAIHYSFFKRPLNMTYFDKALIKDHWFGKSLLNRKSLELILLNMRLDLDHNSNHPYERNNGSFNPTKGLQYRGSIGMYARWKFIEIQVKPDWLFAQNKDYEGFSELSGPRLWWMRYNWWTYADHPEEHGAKDEWRLRPGQSYLKFNYRKFSLGLSSQNLWWGPGKKNALLMTNAAEGFWHLSLETHVPIDTKIGTFEGQLIGGLLNNSDYSPPDTSRQYGGKTNLYVPFRDENRYLSGIHVSYQPKWVAGLFLGFSYVNQQYLGDARGEGDMLAALTDVFRRNEGIDDRIRPDRYASLSMRWIWKEAQVEVYFEGGKNKFQGFKEFLMVPEKDAGFVLGFTKLFDLPRLDNFLEVGMELTKLAQPTDYSLAELNSWYIDQNIRHGYTHKGQWIGAGIGPGSNLATIDLSWLNADHKLGLVLERERHNSDFYYLAFEHNRDWNKYWVDYTIGIQGYTQIKELMIQGRITRITSLNYQWVNIQNNPDDAYIRPGNDLINWNFNLSVIYHLPSK